MTDSTTPARPVPDDLADKMEATLNLVREVADLMDGHFGDCPGTTIEEAAEVRRTAALFRSARRPVTLVPDAVVQLVKLTEDLNAAQQTVCAHIDRCPESQAS